MRILLLSDDLAQVDTRTRALASHFDVTVVSSGDEALRLLEQDGPFAGVVCDPDRPASTSLLEHLDQLGRAQDLLQFVTDLCALEGLDALARRAASALHRVLDGRAVSVQLFDDTQSSGVVEVSCGRGGSMSRHRIALRSNSTPVGEIVVDLEDHTPLSGRELDVVHRIAQPTAERVAQELARSDHDLAQQGILVAMAQLAERRDDETGRHLARVSRYSRLIARGLREDGAYVGEIDDAFIEDLYRAAPLHDIGKIGIADAVLLKPGRLDAREWALMKTHAELGGHAIDEVVRSLERPGFLTVGSEIAWAHHERWDGGGYPRGLRGVEIPLAARILALADVYDALTSERPYKHAWSHAEAVAYVQDVSGSHLDPVVVHSFERRLDEVEAIRARFTDAPVGREAPVQQLLDVA
ncbi:MAG: HD domain-containing protein [bacterium]|nr:HD domain-containing protein [bacterium]